MLDSGALKNWRLLLSTTGRRWQFAALVTGFEGASPVVGKQSADVTLKKATMARLSLFTMGPASWRDAADYSENARADLVPKVRPLLAR